MTRNKGSIKRFLKSCTMKINRKAVAVLLFLLALLATGCHRAKEDENAWTVEDFSLYTLDGKLYDYPQSSHLRLEKGYNNTTRLQLKRGVRLYSPAKVVLDTYDFSNFYFTLTKYPSADLMSKKEEAIEKAYFEKYPDKNEAIKHTSELSKYGLNLWIYGYFLYKDEKLTPLEHDKVGYVIIPEDIKNDSFERYSMDIIIKNDSIIRISLGHTYYVDGERVD